MHTRGREREWKLYALDIEKPYIAYGVCIWLSIFVLKVQLSREKIIVNQEEDTSYYVNDLLFLFLSDFIWEQHRVDKEQCNALLISYIEDNSHMYPMQVGENFTDEEKNHMALFLVSAFMF